MKNQLIDIWFTREQLQYIKAALTEYTYDCSHYQGFKLQDGPDEEIFRPIINHIDHAINTSNKPAIML